MMTQESLFALTVVLMAAGLVATALLLRALS
jgi:hypothetical protein